MSNLVKNSVLVVSILMLTVIVTGCSSPPATDKALRPTKDAAFNETGVTVFRPKT